MPILNPASSPACPPKSRRLAFTKSCHISPQRLYELRPHGGFSFSKSLFIFCLIFNICPYILDVSLIIDKGVDDLTSGQDKSSQVIEDFDHGSSSHHNSPSHRGIGRRPHRRLYQTALGRVHLW
jgi:hypothetical protein